jgi:hypothetical protein
MRDIPATIAAAWSDGLFIGDRKPTARVTVQHPDMKLRNFSLMSTFSTKVTGDIKSDDITITVDPAHGHKVHQTYADFLFTGHDKRLKNFLTAINTLVYGADLTPKQLAAEMHLSPMVVANVLSGKLDDFKTALKIAVYLDGDPVFFTKLYKNPNGLEQPKELPNVKSVSWERSVDTDVASATITCWNTKPLDIGHDPMAGELDLPGYYTYNRGGASFSSRFGKHQNDWFGMLVPDNLIRTYEGYGSDLTVPAELDPFLVQTGLWIIDSVSSTTDGMMTIKCRDIGRILLDQMFYQPVVPKDFYDEGFKNWDGTFPTKPAQHKIKVKAQDSSNTPWIGTGTVQGHKLSWAFDGDPNTYWLSIGNIAASRRFAYEWVQCSTGNQTVNRVKFRTKKKGYTAYISVKVAGAWQGTGKINYHEDGIGQNGGDIHYVKSVQVDTEGFIDVTLPKAYAKAQSVRVTLGNLQDFHFGPYQYRGGIRDVEVYGPGKAGSRGYKKGPAGSNPGRYDDYTDIVKLLCAWGGFFWPIGGKQRISDGTYRTCSPAKADSSVLGAGVNGRVWGDFQQSGTNGPAALAASNFDKKSLMDGISYIRDILGFLFTIDETGGVVWRLPNVFDFGCYVGTISENPGYAAGEQIRIDERSVLLELTNQIDSKNVREGFFVGDVNGKLGSFAPGFNPNPTGLRRMAGWTDQNFGIDHVKGHTKKQDREDALAAAQLMADMLSLRTLFTFRTAQIRIPANPKIQIDDQVRIYERTTAEGYIHYVNSISSSLDIETGEWVYDMQTHWLGEDPESKWIFSTEQLFDVTKAFLKDQAKLIEEQLIEEQLISRKLKVEQSQ